MWRGETLKSGLEGVQENGQSWKKKEVTSLWQHKPVRKGGLGK